MTDLKKLIIVSICHIIGRNAVRLWIEEHKADENYPEKAESVSLEIWEECEPEHLEEGLLLSLIHI